MKSIDGIDYDLVFQWLVDNCDKKTFTVKTKCEDLANFIGVRKAKLYLNKAMIERKCGITFYNENGLSVFKLAPDLCTDGNRKKQILGIIWG